MTRQKQQKIWHMALLMGVLSLLSYPYPAAAQFFIGANAQAGGGGVAPAESPCDPDYYESLESQAWLEAQREITQNQNLITKPDSVLELTCFDKQLDVIESEAENMFSESDRWGSVDGVDNTTTDDALVGLVAEPLKEYIERNFEHDLRGGRSDLNYEPEAETGGGTYNCDMMNKIWQEAKCADALEAEGDGFFTFAEYASGDDKRSLPEQCEKPDYQTQVDASTGENTPWEEDPVETYYDQTNPESCGDATPQSYGTGDAKFCPEGCKVDGNSCVDVNG